MLKKIKKTTVAAFATLSKINVKITSQNQKITGKHQDLKDIIE